MSKSLFSSTRQKNPTHHQGARRPGRSCSWQHPHQTCQSRSCQCRPACTKTQRSCHRKRTEKKIIERKIRIQSMNWKNYECSQCILLCDSGNEEILIADVEERGGSQGEDRRPHIRVGDHMDAEQISHRTAFGGEFHPIELHLNKIINSKRLQSWEGEPGAKSKGKSRAKSRRYKRNASKVSNQREKKKEDYHEDIKWLQYDLNHEAAIWEEGGFQKCNWQRNPTAGSKKNNCKLKTREIVSKSWKNHCNHLKWNDCNHSNELKSFLNQ